MPPNKWTSTNESNLLLILLAYHTKRGTGPNWDAVASLMGEGFTASAVSQYFTKKLAKREVYALAKTTFQSTGSGEGGIGGPVDGSLPKTPKKRKTEDATPKKEEEGE